MKNSPEFSALRSVEGLVDPNFAIIEPQHPGAQGVREFLTGPDDRRIALATGSMALQRHELLRRTSLPLLPATERGKDAVLLDVPRGARPMAAFLRSMERNPATAQGLLQGIGELLGHVHEENIDLDGGSEYPLLRQLAYGTDRRTGRNRLYLVPPYDFGNTHPQILLPRLESEFEAAGVLSVAHMDAAITDIDLGWHGAA